MHALLCALVVVAAPADTTPPTITHTPVRRVDPSSPLLIKAHISDPNGVFDPSVSWRLDGETSFRRAAMVGKGPGDFEATIPNANLRSKAVEYFIEAFDELGNGPARFGNPDKPIRVAIATVEEMAGAPPAPAPQPQPAQPAPAQPTTTTTTTARADPAIPVTPPSTLAGVTQKKDDEPTVTTEMKTTMVEKEREESKTPIIVGVVAAVAAGGGIAVVVVALGVAVLIASIFALSASGRITLPGQQQEKGVSSVDVSVSGPSPSE